MCPKYKWQENIQKSWKMVDGEGNFTWYFKLKSAEWKKDLRQIGKYC